MTRTYKKLLVTTLSIIGLTLLSAPKAEAGLFGDWLNGGLKPEPNFTVLGQGITWPVPSLCVGAKAGKTADTKVSTKGLYFKLPFFELDLPFPTLTLGTKNHKVNVGVHGVAKAETDGEKTE